MEWKLAILFCFKADRQADRQAVASDYGDVRSNRLDTEFWEAKNSRV